MSFRNSRLVFALEDGWELLKKVYGLNVIILFIVMRLWCEVISRITHNQTIPIGSEVQAIYVRDYIWYWLIIVCLWMFNHGWYTLIFVFRNRVVRLHQYWTILFVGLFILLISYSLHALVGGLFTLFPLFNQNYRDYLQGADSQHQDERGSSLLSSHQAERHYRRIRPRDDRGILWGGVRIPTTHAVTNFVVIGTVGSGKTLTLQLLLQSLLQLEGGTSHESES